MTRPKCACLNPKAPRRQFGSLRILPSGKHQARYIGADGRMHKAPVTFETHTDAETFLSTVRADIVRGSWSPPKATPLTFGDYAERWLSQRELKPRTFAQYRTMLDKLLLPEFGERDLAAITAADVRSWFARVQTGKVYRGHAYGLLRSIMRIAVDDGLIQASPCVIRGAATSKRQIKIRPASLPELAALVEAMPDNLRLAVHLAAWCALRYGEIAELRRTDIDLRKGVIHVRRAVAWVNGTPGVGLPKSSAGVRDVAIPPHLLPTVKAHLERHTAWGREGLLFTNTVGKHLASTSFYAAWWPAREQAGRPDLRFHDLRHTGAVLAAQTGATLAELMNRLGHSSPTMAMRYQHVAQGRDQQIAEALSKLAEGGQA
jgi:integrase